MNFKNRLEALKWMCENPGEKVYYSNPSTADLFPYASLTIKGQWSTSHGVNSFDETAATNFRTTPEYTPDPKPEPEFEWPRDLRCFLPRVMVTEKNLFDYHAALMEYLDKRFVRK